MCDEVSPGPNPGAEVPRPAFTGQIPRAAPNLTPFSLTGPEIRRPSLAATLLPLFPSVWHNNLLAPPRSPFRLWIPKHPFSIASSLCPYDALLARSFSRLNLVVASGQFLPAVKCAISLAPSTQFRAEINALPVASETHRTPIVPAPTPFTLPPPPPTTKTIERPSSTNERGIPELRLFSREPPRLARLRLHRACARTSLPDPLPR
jgi:hypothetical protein